MHILFCDNVTFLSHQNYCKKYYVILINSAFKMKIFFYSHMSLRNRTEVVIVIIGREEILFTNFRVQNKRVVRKGSSSTFSLVFSGILYFIDEFSTEEVETDNYCFSLQFRQTIPRIRQRNASCDVTKT